MEPAHPDPSQARAQRNLAEACKRGDLPLIRDALARGALPNARAGEEFTPLLCLVTCEWMSPRVASEDELAECFRTLIRAGADPTARVPKRDSREPLTSPIFVSISLGAHVSTRAMLEAAVHEPGLLALCVDKSSNLSAASSLLDFGADPHEVGGDGKSAWEIATARSGANQGRNHYVEFLALVALREARGLDDMVARGGASAAKPGPRL